MRALSWLSLFFLSASWLLLVGFFTQPNYTVGLILIILGILLSIFIPVKIHLSKLSLASLLLFVILLIPPFIVIPFPYNLGIFILILSFLIEILSRKMEYSIPRKLQGALSISAIFIILQSAIISLYFMYAPIFYDFSFLSPIVYGISRLFTPNVALYHGILYLKVADGSYPFTVTIGKLCIFYVILFFVPSILLVSCSAHNKLRALLSVFGAFFLYMIVRYVALMFLFPYHLGFSVYWDPFYVLISFFPLPFILGTMTNLKEKRIMPCTPSEWTSILLLTIAIFSLVGAISFQDPGARKAGRVLVDEVHSMWEDTKRKMDTEWYGKLSTYNYYSWYEWLGKYYNMGRLEKGPITREILKNYDILIIKCPTKPFSKDEVKAILDFVREGGGLYLIGDHTNVFGMNYYLNQISMNFGITFNFDSTYNYPFGFTTYRRQAILPHVIVQRMDVFQFLTSCTLDVHPLAEKVMVGYQVLSEPGSYATENFFRRSFSSPDGEVGLFVQAAALKYGKGRVVAFSDSTCFSSFCIFMDGYTKFNLGVMEYLNRENKYDTVNFIFFALSIICLAIFTFMLKKERSRKALISFIVVAVLTFSLSSIVFSHLNLIFYPLPKPHTNYSTICFDKEHSSFIISAQPPLSVDLAKRYDTFFIWTQRVGYVPSIEKSLETAIKRGDVVVIINPVKSFTAKEREMLKSYVENGGKLLLLDTITNSKSTSNEILDTFGLHIERIQQSVELITQNTTRLAKPQLSVIGNCECIIGTDNSTHIAVKDYGRGKVVVVVDSYTFSNAVMGGSFTIPNDLQRAVYETEFFILDNLIK